MDLEKPERTNKQKWFRWIKLFIIIYCLIGILVFYLQDKFIFHPTVIKTEDSFNFKKPFTEITIQVDEATSYNVVQFPSADTITRGVVLYFHGNMDNIEHYAPVANNFTKHGYELWMMDYPGFGKSRGELSEQVLYEEALEVYRMARARFSTDSIVIYGRSLGTGIAAQLASIRDCKQLVLEAPYYSMTSLASRYFWMYPIGLMVKYKIPTNEYLQKVTAPITIFHGTEDDVIPFSNSKKLKALLKPGDSFIDVQKAEHNNLLSFPIVQEKLSEIMR